MQTITHTTPDPATGEPANLRQLAKRYGVHYSTIKFRYQQGKRGQALVCPRYRKPGQAPRPAPTPTISPNTAKDRKRMARQILATPAGRLAACRFKDYGKDAA